MPATRNFPLSMRLAAAALLGAGGLALANAVTPAPAPAAPEIEASFVSPAEARALGARWRETGRAGLGRNYAQALLAAGLPGELLSAIGEEGLFKDAPEERALFRAEALLRLYRYADAIAEASARSLADDPYAAFIRVRAKAARGAGLDREALALATRGPAELAREAWLLRARAALDGNDFATADASLKRAGENGATAARVETFAIERDIRAGRTEAAAEALALRARSLARSASERGEIVPDYEGMRLAAMLALRLGDGREAARLADRGGLSAPGGPGAAFAAFAKWVADDGAQAQALLADHFRAAPGDWAARDVAAALAYHGGKAVQGDAHLDELAQLRPQLAAFRRLKRAEALGDLDRAFSFVDELGGEQPLTGAAAALLGPGAATPRLPEPVAADHDLIAAMVATDLRSVRNAVSRLLDARRSPVDLAAAARALARAGDADQAAALAFDASQAAKTFFAPVALRAEILGGRGRGVEAIGAVEAFLAANPRRDDARLYRALLLWALNEPRRAAEAFAALDPALVFADDRATLDYAKAASVAGDPYRQGLIDAAAALPPRRRAPLLEALGDAEGAAAAYRQALIADPSAEDFPEAYRALMARLGRAEDAEALLAALARRRPGLPETAPKAAAKGAGALENANL
ncbi:MAG: hypothetical protein U5J99_10350 [Parvularculaceae bacterium]|nr:hypothetical protein [Parvularculaceae bacterium]